MKRHLIPVPFAAAGIVVYWFARWTDNLKLVSVIQPAITIICLLVIVLAATGPRGDRKLSIWIGIGLLLALLGDFLNVDMSDPAVVIRGLIIFVAAYLSYIIGLTIMNGFHRKDIIVGIGALGAYAGLMAYLLPFLGDMAGPGMVYGLILPLLVTRAVSTFFGSRFTLSQAVFLTIGASMLYLGDVEFALHSYPEVMPMIFGPFLYAGGQLMIALSTGFGAGRDNAMAES